MVYYNSMGNTAKIITIFFVIIILLFTPSSVLLAAKFNPDFIISDEEMLDWRSLSRVDINSFLKNQGGYIANLVTEDAAKSRRRALDIIYRAAKEYKINPKYILVKLQKEQSLITDPNPSQRQIDWATGYGVCDSCDTTDPELQKHKGFGKQVDSAAGIMRWYYDNVDKELWIKKSQVEYQIDNVIVKPANLATAFLYTYTPHLQGNENFWKLWQQWFDQVYPDGTLIKALDDPTIYSIQDGKTRAIKNMSVLRSRFNPTLLITVPASELARYSPGSPINFSNYSILKSNNSYYLLDYDTIRPFADAGVVRKLGYNPDEIIDVASEDIAEYEIGQIITLASQYLQGRLIKLPTSNSIYYIKDNAYYSIPDPQIAKLRFPNLTIKSARGNSLNKYTDKGTLLFPDGALIGLKDSGKIYVVEKDKLRHITSESAFNNLGYKSTNIIWISESIASLYQFGDSIYIRESKTEPNQPANSLTSAQPQNPPIVSATSFAAKKPAIPISSSTSGAVTFAETGKTIVTPDNQTIYTGNQKISTKIDTYLIAEYNGDSATILAGKNLDNSRPLASFIKVMTAFRLFAEGINLDNVVTFDQAKHLTVENYFKISTGDQISNRDLLYSFLVSSLNVPGRMLVQSVEPDEKAFIKRMNEQARAWGLNRTYFNDVYGYDVNNQSTAREFLTIFTKALGHATIKKYLGATSYEYNEVIDTDNNKIHQDTHTNKIALKTNLSYNVLASKTGYLYEAGYGIAMLIERKSDNKQFIIIIMGNPNYVSRFNETERITQWAINIF